MRIRDVEEQLIHWTGFAALLQVFTDVEHADGLLVQHDIQSVERRDEIVRALIHLQLYALLVDQKVIILAFQALLA